MFEIIRSVGHSAIDAGGFMRISSLVDFCQDCEGFQLDADPVVEEFNRDNNATCFIVMRQLEILRPIRYGERLTIKTGVFSEERMLAHRNTLVYGQDGQLLVKGYSIGSVVSKDTGHSIRRSDDQLKKYSLVEKFQEMEYQSRRIMVKGLEIGSRHEPWPVKIYQIDKNRHVNNSKYLDVVMECLPAGYQPSHLRIVYKAPAALGDIIYPVEYETGEDTHLIGLLDQEGNSYVTVELW